MVPNFDLYKYQQELNSNSVLLVPNQRLARRLISYACEKQSSASHQVITGFNIYSLNDFINNLYNIINESGWIKNSRYLLNYWQREVIFKNIVEDYVRQDNKFSHVISSSIYNKVVPAWQISKLWKLPQNTFDLINPEIELFTCWSKEYEKILENSQYHDPDDKISLIISVLEPGLLQLLNITNIDLYGFDDIPPIYTDLFYKLEQNFIQITTLDPPNINSHIKPDFKLFQAQDVEDEFDNLSHWALYHYEQGIDNIGIIIPNLGQHRQLINKKFSEKFTCRDAWNISGGEPLSEVPVIKVALILLDVLNSSINSSSGSFGSAVTIQNIIYLLKSEYYLKYINNDQKNKSVISHQSQVHDLIILLQQEGYKELTIKDFIYYIGKINKSFTDVIINHKSQIPHSQYLPSVWSQMISSVLTKLGWPAGHGTDTLLNTNKINNINSLEYQAIMRWQKCCYQLATLDNILGSVSFKKILSELKNLLQALPFQIETNKNSIDILGMLEGAGLFYNKLWIANLTSDIWPTPPDPNPFIAMDIQKKYNLPHSTVEREFEYAKKLTNRYLRSSEDITISYNKFDGEKENDLSFLLNSNFGIHNLNSYLDSNLNFNHPSKLESHLTPNLDSQLQSDLKITSIQKINKFKENKNYLPEIKINNIPDYVGPDIVHSHIKTGVRALALQVTCPFRAFVEIRLNAVNINDLEIGPAAWLRGQVIHEVLQHFYFLYNTKYKISNFYADRENYKIYLNKLILDVLVKYRAKHFNIYKMGIVKLEQEIIYNIIDPFIALDLQRQDFTVVATEETCLFKLDNIQFNVRVDRIDQVNQEHQASLVIIDYKTSPQNINNLFKEELTEPQLPIYLFLDKHTDAQAVIFAELLYQQVGYKGIGSNKVIDGCLKIEHWDELKSKWYHLLNKSAVNFAKGEASREPINLEATCRTCHLSGLCRKDEVCH